MKGYAPGWQIRCLKCGFSVDASQGGVIRIGGIGKNYTLGKCERCGKWRILVIERAGSEARPMDRRKLIAFLVLFPLLLAAGILGIVTGAMKGSGAYQLAMELIQSSPQAIECLGEPIRSRMFVAGSIRNGCADIAIRVYGPKGEGRCRVRGEKIHGEWKLSSHTLTLGNSGETIDLLHEPKTAIDD